MFDISIFFFASIFTMTTPERSNYSTNSGAIYADVVGVSTTGQENSYKFSVTLSSPDKGCEQYADWWEVIAESGDLIYRRILGHSHVNEQPFTRSGGSVPISKDQVVWVRSHMNKEGYGGRTMKGSVSEGFLEVSMPEDFALDLEKAKPLPTGCAF